MRQKRETGEQHELVADLPSATIRTNGEIHFHQQIWPAQASSGQNWLGQLTPSRTIAELLHVAWHIEPGSRERKDSTLVTTITGQRIRDRFSGIQQHLTCGAMADAPFARSRSNIVILPLIASKSVVVLRIKRNWYVLPQVYVGNARALTRHEWTHDKKYNPGVTSVQAGKIDFRFR